MIGIGWRFEASPLGSLFNPVATAHPEYGNERNGKPPDNQGNRTRFLTLYIWCTSILKTLV